ncbi:ROK family protein [Verrucomicrobiota bacterium]
MTYRTGIDLGGTKTEGIVLDPDGEELFRKRIPTRRDRGYSSILDSIKGLYREMTEAIDGAEHTFGIGTPGAISSLTGLLSLSNTVCMNGKPLKKDLEERLGREIELQNDANCFAMAEAILGAGRGKRLVFGVIMGTGCGGGIVDEGKAVSGLNLRGGEWGHMSIDPNGPECFCGRRGCVETFISGGGVEKRYEREFGNHRSFKDIQADYEAGDAKAVEFTDVFFRDFGRAVANLITVLDPDIIVLGGGVSRFDAIYTRGVEEVAKRILGEELRTPIVKHKLGDSAGVVGAALIGT